MSYISKSFTRFRFAVSYVYAIDSKFQCMQLTIHSYFARHICKQLVRAISVRRRCPICMILILGFNSCSRLFILILDAIYEQIVHVISVRRVLCVCY